MEAVAVIADPTTAAAALDPVRSRLLAELGAEPASAAGVAARLGLARQNARYHLKALEDCGLVGEVDRRAHGGITERVLAARAASYVVSPAALGRAAADPSRVQDRLSAGYLVALAGRAIREIGDLLAGATKAGKRLPTLSIDVDIRFASAAERAAFVEDLAAAVSQLAARYHDESTGGGRWYRFTSFIHPRPSEAQTRQGQT